MSAGGYPTSCIVYYDTTGSTFSEENRDKSDSDKHRTTETAEGADSKDTGSGKGLKQKDLDAEEPE